MKVIDLLNKIAKGEEVPEYIRYRDLSKHEYNTMFVCKENIIYQLDQCVLGLNDEIEIIEEEKEIEEIKTYYDSNLEEHVAETIVDYTMYKEIFNSRYDEMIMNKINELVKAFNELKKEGK